MHSVSMHVCLKMPTGHSWVLGLRARGKWKNHDIFSLGCLHGLYKAECKLANYICFIQGIVMAFKLGNPITAPHLDCSKYVCVQAIKG